MMRKSKASITCASLLQGETTHLCLGQNVAREALRERRDAAKTTF